MPRKEWTGTRFVPEAGVRGKVLRFHGKSIHFPRKNRFEMQIDGNSPEFIVEK